MYSDPLHNWLVYVGMGAVLLLTIVFLPDRLKAPATLVCRPNWMSVVHAPLAWIGYFWLYGHGHHFAAIMLMSLSGGLDLADGRFGRAYDRLIGKLLKDQRFWTQMNYRGTTSLGASLDPLLDKITVIPIFFHICYVFFMKTSDVRNDGALWLSYFAVGFITLMVLADIGGQVIRSDTFRRWRPKKKKEDKSATDVGKYKTLTQWAWLPAWAVWDQGWLPEATTYLIVLDVMLIGLLGLTVASLLSKLRPLSALWKEGFALD